MEPLTIATDFPFDAGDQQVIRAAAGPDSVCVFAQNAAELRVTLSDATVLCTFQPPADLLKVAPKLRWLQYPGAGVDNLRMLDLLRGGSPLIITTASSANAVSTAEYVMGLLLTLARKLDDMVRLQERKVWAVGQHWGELRGFELRGKALGIIGMGAIGRALAPRARAFQMRVLGLWRTAVHGASDPDCDAVFGVDRLVDLLGESDFALICVPLTSATAGMIGEHELRAMRSNAYLINVSRGPVVQEPALIRALRERWLAGAGLDVAAEEPLPAASPLWTLPGVIITPHLSSLTTGYSRRLAQLFAENITRWRQGQPLANRFMPERGY
jgi:phosphoglycerate dehydrogenase-like enzyme